MGSGIVKRVAILALCLGLTVLAVQGLPGERPATRHRPLAAAFPRIGDWSAGDPLAFEESIVEALELDDYLHCAYGRGDQRVWLYVGYYVSGESIGASHSPLVCYPGQGWRIGPRQRLSLETSSGPLHAMVMSAAKDDYEDVVLYWFQAYDRTAPGTFRQKLQAMWARVAFGRADSAFVRISVPVVRGDREAARRTATAFTKTFYPLFHAYVTGDRPQGPVAASGDARS